MTPDSWREYEEIRASYEYEKSIGSASYIECFKGTIGKRTVTGITLQSLQQLVGVNFIFYYVRRSLSSVVYYPLTRLCRELPTLPAGTQLLSPSPFILQVITNVVNVVLHLSWAGCY